MTPTGSSSGRTDGAGHHVGQHQEAATDKEHEREQGSMQRTEYGAHGMRDDQADEADDATGRHARRGQESGREVDHPSQPIDLRPQMVGRLITQSDQIERAGMKQEQCNRNRGVDRKHGEGAPGCTRRSHPAARGRHCGPRARRRAP